MKLEDTDVRLALSTPDVLFGKEGLNYIPWMLHDGQKSYDFGYNNIRSRPVAEVLGWECSSQVENHIYHRSNLKSGTFEWFGPDGLPTVTVKWEAVRGCLESLEKIEAWIQHWTFKTWAVNISPQDKASKAQDLGRCYWEVRKTPDLIRQLVEKARSKCAKPQRSVAEVMEKYRDRFHEAHKWDWYYGGCKSEDMGGVFKTFHAFSDARLDEALEVPDVGPVKLLPHGWVSVPPFKNVVTMPKPINDEGDDELTNELLRIPVKRPQRVKP